MRRIPLLGRRIVPDEGRGDQAKAGPGRGVDGNRKCGDNENMDNVLEENMSRMSSPSQIDRFTPSIKATGQEDSRRAPLLTSLYANSCKFARARQSGHSGHGRTVFYSQAAPQHCPTPQRTISARDSTSGVIGNRGERWHRSVGAAQAVNIDVLGGSLARQLAHASFRCNGRLQKAVRPPISIARAEFGFSRAVSRWTDLPVFNSPAR